MQDDVVIGTQIGAVANSPRRLIALSLSGRE